MPFLLIVIQFPGSSLVVYKKRARGFDRGIQISPETNESTRPLRPIAFILFLIIVILITTGLKRVRGLCHQYLAPLVKAKTAKKPRYFKQRKPKNKDLVTLIITVLVSLMAGG